MGFLYPAFLLGALAIAVPIILHLLRRDVAPEVPFSAVRLLHRSPITRTRRRRLRDLLLLAARIAALALLALAFARPYLAAGEPAGLHIVAIDRSYSMGAPGRFARAQAIAGEAIGEARPGDRLAVIAFDDRADVVAAPGAAADARTAVSALRAGFRTTRYAPVVERAMELAGNAPARLIVVTDFQRSGWDDEQRAAMPANIRVETRSAGDAAPNAAVTAVRVEANRVVATVANRSAAPFASSARLTANGKVLASVALRVPPNGTADAVLSHRTDDRGSVAVSIDDPAGFPADDVRYAALGATDRVRIALVTADGSGASGLYVARALQAAGERFAVDRAPVAASFKPGGSASPGSLVLLSTRGVDRGMREDLVSYIRRGGGALLAAGPDMEPSVIASMFGWTEPRPVGDAASLTLAASDVRHPV
ncbi:MAG TPA: BatA domain-containing protein, partial [Vicinamibacterales bacterium]|nr:BatA domain-containing protein [Vicinamibacterales bacterium]